MSQAKGYPHKQGFCINGQRNKTKKNSWWQHPPYHNNRTNRKQPESN